MSKLLALLGTGRGTMLPICVRGARSDDTLCLFASPARPLLPLTQLRTALKTALSGEGASAPTNDFILDAADSALGNNLRFLGRIGLPPILLATVVELTVDPQPRV